MFRYSGHTLSRKTVNRIFAQIPKKFKSKQKDLMNYEDFVCIFIILLKIITNFNIDRFYSL